VGATGPQGPPVANDVEYFAATAPTATLPDSPTETPVAEVLISPTVASVIQVDAALNVDAVDVGNTAATCRIALDDAASGIPAQETVVAPLLAPAEASITLTGITPTIAPGTHSVTVLCQQVAGAGTARITNRSLSALALAE
jgi:hypothetical protein